MEESTVVVRFLGPDTPAIQPVSEAPNRGGLDLYRNTHRRTGRLRTEREGLHLQAWVVNAHFWIRLPTEKALHQPSQRAHNDAHHDHRRNRSIERGPLSLDTEITGKITEP